MHSIKRIEVEHEEDWFKWMEEIPELTFPAHWRVRIIPPFGGAMARFLVSTDKEERISVYLDVYSSLGYSPDGPYWEVYPVNGDNARVLMHDIEGLFSLIEIALNE